MKNKSPSLAYGPVHIQNNDARDEYLEVDGQSASRKLKIQKRPQWGQGERDNEIETESEDSLKRVLRRSHEKLRISFAIDIELKAII